MSDWINVLSAGIGGLFGGAASYFVSYLKTKGELKAAYENLPTLLQTEFAKAERQKAGELAAIDQHLRDIENQTRAITTVQATIQSQISGELWTKQMVWQQKREMYSRVLNAAHDAATTMLDVAVHISPPNDAQLLKRKMTAVDAMFKLRDSFAEAEICGAGDGIEAGEQGDRAARNSRRVDCSRRRCQ